MDTAFDAIALDLDTIPAPISADAAATMAAFAGAPPTTTAALIEGFASRASALRTLENMARCFRETEPHSPVSCTLAELVRRARMPFVERLAEPLPADAGDDQA